MYKCRGRQLAARVAMLLSPRNLIVFAIMSWSPLATDYSYRSVPSASPNSGSWQVCRPSPGPVPTDQTRFHEFKRAEELPSFRASVKGEGAKPSRGCGHFARTGQCAARSEKCSLGSHRVTYPGGRPQTLTAQHPKSVCSCHQVSAVVCMCGAGH